MPSSHTFPLPCLLQHSLTNKSVEFIADVAQTQRYVIFIFYKLSSLTHTCIIGHSAIQSSTSPVHGIVIFHIFPKTAQIFMSHTIKSDFKNSLFTSNTIGMNLLRHRVKQKDPSTLKRKLKKGYTKKRRNSV